MFLKRLPKSIFIFLGLVFIFETSSAYLGDHFYTQNSDGIKMRVKNHLSLDKKQGFDVLIFGDCYPHTAIQARRLEEATGLSSFNYGTTFFHTNLPSYAMLRNALKSHKNKPQFIILSHLFFSLQPSRKNLKDYQSFLYDFAPGNMDLMWKEFGLQAIKFLIPSLKYQNDIKNFIKNPLSIHLLSSDRLKSMIQNIYDQRGFYTQKKDLVYTKPDPEIWYNQMNHFEASPYSERYLKAFLDLAQSENIPVIYVLPTNPADWFKHLQDLGVKQEYKRYLKALQAHYSNLVIWDPQNEVNRSDYYRSTIHLNTQGSEVLTDWLGRKLMALKKT